MALPGCKISIGVDGDSAYIRLAGRAAAESAASFEKAVLKLQSEGAHRIVLELSEILLMDSGFSGTVSNLVRKSGLCFALFRAPDRILDTLEDHGVLSQVARIEENGDICFPETGEAKALEKGNRKDTLRCCLDAHRTLMTLKPENVAKFQVVEQFLARELEKESGPGN